MTLEPRVDRIRRLAHRGPNYFVLPGRWVPG